MSSFPSFDPSILPTHSKAEAAATLGASEFSKGLLNGACGVETLSQQKYTIEEEKRCQAIDDILEVFDTVIVTKRNQIKPILEKYHNSDNSIKCNSQGGHDNKVLSIAGEVCFHQDRSLGQCFMSTATK